MEPPIKNSSFSQLLNRVGQSMFGKLQTACTTQKKRPITWLTIGLVAATFVITCSAHDTILRRATHLWIVSDPIEPADAVAVLGGGVNTRPFEAAALYKRGFAKQVLLANVELTAAEKLGVLPAHVDVNRQILLKLGVPPEAILGFGSNLTNTYEEGRALADWARHTRAKKLIVPTEYFSTRRVRWILNRELGNVGVHVMIKALRPPEYDPDLWWQYEAGRIGVRNELIKYLYYRTLY
jgi:uncharacterized SAM-binding protein YcdF (DUF218 family)